MINMELELILKWSQNCVLTEKATRTGLDAEGDNRKVVEIDTDLKFNITDCKLYAPVVNLQEKHENELYKNLKTRISFDFEWGRYRTQIITLILNGEDIEHRLLINQQQII